MYQDGKETAPSVRLSGASPLLALAWMLLGPGMLAMIGDNDAGGVISYAVTGAMFGVGAFAAIILLLAPVTYTVQEMTMRLGTVSGRPFPALVFERFGRFWGFFSLAALFVENLLTLVTEFIGMSVGLAALGVPFAAADLICALCVVSFALFGKYWTKERLALFVGALNIVFVVLAVWTHPHVGAVAGAIARFSFPGGDGSAFWFFVIATVGNAVAPWMIFFQGAAVIDRGMTRRDLHLGRLDTALGSAAQSLIAVAIVVCGATLRKFAAVHPAALARPAVMLQGFMAEGGVWVRDLFALGMVNAGFLAAVTISLSTSWTFASVFGWARSLNDHPLKAPKFYALYIGGLVAAALIVLLPGLPLTFLSVLAQVIAAVLMIPLLTFLCRLTSDPLLMGEHRNTRSARARAWAITAAMIALCLLGIARWIG